MSKEQDKKFLNAQTCILKVNMCCDGCQKKVKKVLHKIDGVCTFTIDAEENKVIVTGNADPAILIKNLGKAGKHAELWSVKGGNQQKSQLQKLQLELEHAKRQQKENGVSQKGGGGGGGNKGQKGQKPKQPQLQQQIKGLKDLKFPSLKDLKFPFKKEKKTVRFDLPPMEEIDDGSDYSDDYDEFDGHEVFADTDRFDEHFHGDPKTRKPVSFKPAGNGKAKEKKGGAGKGGAVQVQNKGGGGKKGDGGKQNEVSGGGKNGSNKSKAGNGNGGKKAKNSNPGGVGRGPPMGQPNMMSQMGNMQTSMGLMGNIPAAQGLWAGGGMPPPGYFPGGMVPPEMIAGPNPYQQQYLQALMQQQQQQRMMMMTGQDRAAFPLMGYGYGRPAYVPPPHPHGEPYTMFSDENPNSCSIM